ncbi:unnamed protein product, partial [Oppiella nova]
HLLNTDVNGLVLNKSVEYCDSNRLDGHDCEGPTGASNTVVLAVVVLWLGNFCNGIGFVSFYTIGIPFIDDSVKKKNSPLYLSLTGALRLCGPTLGFMLSSYFDPGIDRRDPRWVGAWWIGFIAIGTGILIFTIPMFLFPRSFTKSDNKISDALNGNAITNGSPAKVSQEKTIWERTLLLVKNPIYVCYVLGTTARLFAVLGYMTFKSKYIESEYKTSASTANLFSGIIGVVPTATGVFLGGLFIRRFLPGPRVLTAFITIVEMIGAIGMFSALFLGCPQSQFAGTTL